MKFFVDTADVAAIAELNDRAFEWVSQAQREIGSLDAQSQPLETRAPA